MHGNPKYIGDVINVDTVSNYIIVSTAFNANSHQLRVFHSSSGQRNPITWRQCEDEVKFYWTANKPTISFSTAQIKID